MVSTSQQVGGAIGTSLLNTIANSATANYAKGRVATVHNAAGGAQLRLSAMVHGFSVAYWVGAGLLTLAALTAAVLINAGPQSGGGAAGHGGGAGERTQDAVPVL